MRLRLLSYLLCIYVAAAASPGGGMSGPIVSRGDGTWRTTGGCAAVPGTDLNDILFVDAANHCVRRLNRRSNTITTIAGGVTAIGGGQFTTPFAVTMSPGSLVPFAVVADHGGGCIHRVSMAAQLPREVATTVVEAIACGGLVTSPSDTAVMPNGDIFITDDMSHTVLLYMQSTHTVELVAGTVNASGFVDGTGGDALFNHPTSITADFAAGLLYIADRDNNAVRVVRVSDYSVRTVISAADAAPALSGPRMVRMVGRSGGAKWLAVADSSVGGGIRLANVTNVSMALEYMHATTVQLMPSILPPGDASVWGITGSIEENQLVFTQPGTDAIGHVVFNTEHWLHTTATAASGAPPLPEEAHVVSAAANWTGGDVCVEDSGPSSVLDESAYIFTTGDAAFLSADGMRLVADRMPPASTPTSTVLSLPFKNFVDTMHQPIQPQPLLGVASVAQQPSVTNISLFLLRTPRVYADTCRIQAVYTVYPAPMTTTQNTPHPPVLVVSFPAGSSDHTVVQIECMHGDGEAYGECTATMEQCKVFSGEHAGSVSPWSVSRNATATLHAYNDTATATMELVMAAAPSVLQDSSSETNVPGSVSIGATRGELRAGVDQFVLDVYVNTGTHALSYWSMTMLPTRMSLVSAEVPDSDLFSGATIVHYKGTVGLAPTVFSHAVPGTPGIRRCGESLHVATLTFNTSADDSPDLYRGVGSIRINFLVSDSGSQFSYGAGIVTVYDSTGKRMDRIAQALMAPAPSPAGLYAWSTAPYVVHRPDGTSTSTHINMSVIQSGYGSEMLAVSGSSCSTTHTDSFSAVSCGQVGGVSDLSRVKPTPGAAVDVTYMGMAARVQIRSYVPVSMRLVVHGGLHPVLPGDIRRYRVLVRWAGDPTGGVSEEVEVTGTQYTAALSPGAGFEQVGDGFVRFNSSNSWNSGGNGTYAELALDTPFAAAFAASTTNVWVPYIDDPSTKTAIAILSYYDDAEPYWESRVSPVFAVPQRLRKEGESHTILALSHGAVIRTKDMRVQNMASSSSSDSYAVRAYVPAADSFAWTGYVPEGAQNVPCDRLVLLANTYHPMTSFVAKRNVHVPLSNATSITLQTTPPSAAASLRLAPSGDASLLTMHSVSSYGGLAAVVSFDDGTTTDMTNDSRVEYEVVNNTCGATTDGRNSVLSVSSQGWLDMRVVYSAPTGEVFHSDILRLRCVVATNITVSFEPLGRLAPTAANTIRRVGCADDVFQSGRVSARMVLSNGNEAIIPDQHVAYSTPTPSILRQSHSTNGFTGTAPGVGIISAVLGGFSANLTVTVLTESVLISSLIVTPFHDDTLLGAHGTEAPIKVALHLGDGSTLLDVLGGGWPDYQPGDLVPHLFNISSNSPDEVDVSWDRGTAILTGNSHQSVSIALGPSAAEQACNIMAGQPIPAAHVVHKVLPVAGNLALLSEGDVDIGHPSGLAIPPLTASGGLRLLPMRVKSAADPLVAFDIALVFDPAVIKIFDCIPGPAWQGSFSCTIHQADGYVQVGLSHCPSSPPPSLSHTH